MAITKYKGRTLGSALLEGLQGYQSAKNQNAENYYKNLDAQAKVAELESKGIVPEMQETPRRFLGLPMGSNKTLAFRYDPTRNVDYQTNELKRRKLEAELADKEMIQQIRQDYLNRSGRGGKSIGTAQGQASDDSEELDNEPMAFNPMSGKLEKNPAYLDPLKEKKLEKMKKQEMADAEAQKEREEILRQEANQNLGSISAVKKGKEFFGPLGNLPTYAAPSSLVGKWGDRRNWETNLDRLLSGKVIEVMTNMKKASKTGATGFGQLSNKELTLLKEASTALKKDIPEEQALFYLNEMEKIQKKMLGSAGGNTVPEFESESDIPDDFSGEAIIGGRRAVIE